MHKHEARPEDRGLLVGALSKTGTAEALGEAQVVADPRARSGLPPDAALVHHQGPESLRGAVDGRGQARRPSAHDDEVGSVLLDAGRGPGGLRYLGVGGVAQGPAVGKDHERELRLGPRLGEQLPPLIGLGQREVVRDGATLEDLPQLIGPARPFLANDVDGVWNDASVRRPLEQKTGDGLVKTSSDEVAGLDT